MDLLARGTCVPAVTARGAIVEKGLKRCKAIGDYLNNHRQTSVGAAEGCDLLTLFFSKQDQKIAASFHSTAPTGPEQAYFLAAALAFAPR
ncbi:MULTISPECIES: hypothetical protein [unclassified Pseudomonas]|uniref:hypothetical protein n=1 Tax=unclassified Pseudomonas TaxID=196821 RepID=UPI001B33397A|nr:MULTISPECIES: hypothetical protein [unclassified Pseudomonas]MBP5945940.1 hypothetical protein [Pseudomonas sp. P9(2020)]MBZ9564080.1 hypothetical protein [Pseudomonas sp. P116]